MIWIVLVLLLTAFWLAYKLGQHDERIEQSEVIVEQAERGKAIREEIDNLTPAERNKLREKWTR